MVNRSAMGLVILLIVAAQGVSAQNRNDRRDAAKELRQGLYLTSARICQYNVVSTSETLYLEARGIPGRPCRTSGKVLDYQRDLNDTGIKYRRYSSDRERRVTIHFVKKDAFMLLRETREDSGEYVQTRSYMFSHRRYTRSQNYQLYRALSPYYRINLR